MSRTILIKSIHYLAGSRLRKLDGRTCLKVSYSRQEILVSSILPKNELENVNFCPSLLGQTFFVRFFGELKKTKSPFEINCPLAYLGLLSLTCLCQ